MKRFLGLLPICFCLSWFLGVTALSLVPLHSADLEPDLNPLPETVFTNTTESVVTNTAETVVTNTLVEEMITAERAWRSFLQIQGQLDTALLALERNRRENEATTEGNQTKINEGLRSIEKVLQAQQEREITALRESNRNMLIVAGVFAGVGFISMFFTSLFHLRSMNRLGSIAATIPAAHSRIPLYDAEEERLLEVRSGQQTGQRLLSAIERLEKRVHELELTPPLTDDVQTEFEPEDQADSEGQDQLSMILGKGQALLSLGKAEEALACFDQALALAPHHAETLVKKGSALEKLNRLDEAIACYDDAIAANQSMTLAYLYKGGLYNRMERYNEALACYEKALRSQQHSEPPAEPQVKS